MLRRPIETYGILGDRQMCTNLYNSDNISLAYYLKIANIIKVGPSLALPSLTNTPAPGTPTTWGSQSLISIGPDHVVFRVEWPSHELYVKPVNASCVQAWATKKHCLQVSPVELYLVIGHLFEPPCFHHKSSLELKQMKIYFISQIAVSKLLDWCFKNSWWN